jgi:MFS family permease
MDCDFVLFQWGLVCSERYVPRLIISLLFVGLLIGALVGGQLADMYGRKWILIVSWMLLMASHSAGALAHNWATYAAIRTITGTFCGMFLFLVFLHKWVSSCHKMGRASIWNFLISIFLTCTFLLCTTLSSIGILFHWIIYTFHIPSKFQWFMLPSWAVLWFWSWRSSHILSI